MKFSEKVNSDYVQDAKLKDMVNAETFQKNVFTLGIENPTLGDYLKGRKAALDFLISKSREKKQEVEKKLSADLQSGSDLAMDLLEESGPDYTGGDD